MTIGDAVREARRFVPFASLAECMAAAKEVHAEVCGAIPQASRVSAAEALAFAAGQREAAVGLRYSQIEAVYWNGAALSETTVEQLTKLHRGWREEPASEPARFYIAGGAGQLRVGLDPKPASSGSATVYGSVVDEPLTYGTELSGALPSGAAYVYGIAARVASYAMPEAAPLLWQLYQSSLAAAQAHAATASEPVKRPPFPNLRSNVQSQPDQPPGSPG